MFWKSGMGSSLSSARGKYSDSLGSGPWRRTAKAYGKETVNGGNVADIWDVVVLGGDVIFSRHQLRGW
jgi:hypothetical protein